ncbi:MAG: hypothetical protein AB1801_20610 [Chloroflexota bacterium]
MPKSEGITGSEPVGVSVCLMIGSSVGIETGSMVELLENSSVGSTTGSRVGSDIGPGSEVGVKIVRVTLAGLNGIPGAPLVGVASPRSAIKKMILPNSPTAIVTRTIVTRTIIVGANQLIEVPDSWAMGVTGFEEGEEFAGFLVGVLGG